MCILWHSCEINEALDIEPRTLHKLDKYSVSLSFLPSCCFDFCFSSFFFLLNLIFDTVFHEVAWADPSCPSFLISWDSRCVLLYSTTWNIFMYRYGMISKQMKNKNKAPEAIYRSISIHVVVLITQYLIFMKYSILIQFQKTQGKW